MSRRVRTLIVSGILFVILFVLVLVLPVPYVILSPGPTCNTLATDTGSGCTLGVAKASEIIVIDGHQVNRTSGNLNLVTVHESGSGITAFQAIVGWLKSDQVVVPNASVNPPGTSEKQVQKQNTADFAQSQDSAIVAAGCQLNYPVKHVEALQVSSTGASKDALEPHDVIDSVDGMAVTSQQQLLAALDRTKPGQRASLGITRDGKTLTEPVNLGPALSGRTGGSLGISVADLCPLPFKVDLGLGNLIGGPSAGMMFALGIIDKVGTQDLTGGRFIAGTGTIDDAGNVGPIGGIALKMIAARRAGATVFLAPAGNCGDVRNVIPAGLRVVKVDSLSGAVSALLAIKAGKSVPSC